MAARIWGDSGILTTGTVSKDLTLIYKGEGVKWSEIGNAKKTSPSTAAQLEGPFRWAPFRREGVNFSVGQNEMKIGKRQMGQNLSITLLAFTSPSRLGNHLASASWYALPSFA